MDLGFVMLLELNQLSTGKRMAFCLLSGEFVLVSEDASQQFGATTAIELVGQSVFPLLVPFDTEKLMDLARQAETGVAGYDGACQLATMARIARTGGMLWIRLLTVPVSLRLLRCMDSISQLRSLNRFADADSFVLSDDELVRTGNMPDASFPSHSSKLLSESSGVCALDDGLFDRLDVSQHGPLELACCKCDAISPAMPTSGSPSEVDAMGPSLASYAFEADWMTELMECQGSELASSFSTVSVASSTTSECCASLII